jgi:signal peptidase II
MLRANLVNLPKKSIAVRQSIPFILAIILLTAADQASKLWMRGHLSPGESLLEGWPWQFTLVTNTGVAFGLPLPQIVPLSLSIAVILIAVLAFWHYPFLHHRLPGISLGLIIGGCLGNLIDRFYLGCVIDFIAFPLWPTFNLADSAIVIGVILFAYFFLRVRKTRLS